MNPVVLAKRAEVIRAVREFFWSFDFIEVETPIRISAPAMEPHIIAPESGNHWLRTSPELHMKRLISEGASRIFQIGSCFREGEKGRRHNPEFTLLEWYRAYAGLEEILQDTESLVSQILGIREPFTRITVEEAYLKWAGWNPLETWDADRFDLDMVNSIEPNLPKTPCFLIGYPREAAALARISRTDPRAAERAELYVDGLEIANGYGELRDPVEQRKRFEEAKQARIALGQPVYPLDEDFLKSLERFPPSGGIALGIDRLVMLACGVKDIAEIRPFC